MLEQRIQQQFFESADLQYQAAEVLARPIAEATAALLAALTGGGKVMVCGSGAGAALAPHLARLFAGRFEAQEREAEDARGATDEPAKSEREPSEATVDEIDNLGSHARSL